MRKKIIAAVVIVAVVAGGGYWYQQKRATAAAAESQPRYIMAKVQKGDIRSTISGTGPVASVNGVSMKANQAGTVAQILAQDGDRVKKGQVIMVLENPTLKASLQQAQVDMQNTRTSLENLLNPQQTSVRAQQLKVENARLTLQQRQQDVANLTVNAPVSGLIASVATTEGSTVAAGALLYTVFDDTSLTFVVALPQQTAALVKEGDKVAVELTGIGKVTGSVLQSGSSATPTTGNRDANVPISIALPATKGVRAGMVGTATFDVPGATYVVQGNGSIKNNATEIRTKVAGTVGQLAVKEGDRVTAGSLVASLSSDTLTLQLQQAQNDVATQEQSLLNLIDPAKDPSGQAWTLQQKLEQNRITLENREADVADLMVKAPVDGQISSLTPRVGDKITTNQALFRVADYGAVQVTIAVDELDIAKVKVGQNATITLDALPGKNYRGKVSKMNPEGIFKNDIATFEVTVAIDKPEGLMAGMNSSVSVEVESKPGVLWLPAQAVTVRQGKAFVNVLNEKKESTQKEIQVGLRTSQQVEVTGGINEGEEVILTTIKANTTTTGFPMGGMGGMGGGQGGQNVQRPAGSGAPTGGQTQTAPAGR
ncbi:MAG TPA: efflux RND transporter periplasmic adaptor subunit [Symbiobacteriaceae bacterium]|nr:efflux RND transporter periplasmic adaptor subunit [Symbiobacteriaceae bacterium]